MRRLVLTPDVIEGAYSYFILTPPFRRWKLPPADEIEFRVSREQDCRGWYNRKNGVHQIAISELSVGSTDALMRAVGHEIVHLRQGILGSETANTQHNAEWHRLAKQVCAWHCFDYAAFC